MVHFSQAGVGYVQVVLGGRQAGVPQQLLHRAQIRTAIEQVRGKRMPQRMRVY